MHAKPELKNDGAVTPLRQCLLRICLWTLLLLLSVQWVRSYFRYDLCDVIAIPPVGVLLGSYRGSVVIWAVEGEESPADRWHIRHESNSLPNADAAWVSSGLYDETWFNFLGLRVAFETSNPSVPIFVIPTWMMIITLILTSVLLNKRRRYSGGFPVNEQL